MADRDTSNRGFAQMDDEKQRQIASKGGRAAHEKGTAHRFTSEEAREAGRKGGERSHRSQSHSHQAGSRQGEQGGSRQGEHAGSQQGQHGGTYQGEQGGSRQGEQGGTRGGNSEQHSEAGRQSHKNS